jgi:hypothetical protein
MKNKYLVLVTLFLGSLYAGPVEKSTADEKRKTVKTLTHSIISTKAHIDATTKELKAQRDSLKQKILTTRKEFRDNAVTLKNSINKAVDDLHTSLKKLKANANGIDETRDAESTATQAAAEEASLHQAAGTLDNVDLPKEISD